MSFGEFAISALPWLVGVVVASVAWFGGWKKLKELFAEWMDAAAKKTGIPYLAYVDDLAVKLLLKAHNESASWLRTAASDGKITKEEAQELAQRLKGLISVKTLKDLLGEAGMAASDETVSEYLEASAAGASEAVAKLRKDPSNG